MQEQSFVWKKIERLDSNSFGLESFLEVSRNKECTVTGLDIYLNVFSPLTSSSPNLSDEPTESNWFPKSFSDLTEFISEKQIHTASIATSIFYY